jgi:hypothetical protein
MIEIKIRLVTSLPMEEEVTEANWFDGEKNGGKENE